MTRVQDIADMIDHALLHPALTDAELKDGCALADRYRVASVCIKPYAVKQAVQWLEGSPVRVGTVIGFPHGSAAIPIKVTETENSCRDGAREIDMVVNVGRALGADWAYVEREIDSVLNTCRNHGAILKVIFENGYLTGDSPKIRLCEICSRLRVDFVKTATGFGFVRGRDGRYNCTGAEDHDLKLMRRVCHPDVGVKASGGVRTLDDALRVRALGATRIGASATADIMEEAIRRFG